MQKYYYEIDTMIRIPVPLRDRLKKLAKSKSQKNNQVKLRDVTIEAITQYLNRHKL